MQGEIPPLRAQLDEAIAAIRRRTAREPRIGIVLGSGLNSLADELEDADRIPYSEIPGFVVPSVAGHSGQLVFASTGGVEILAMQGRLHAYEGHRLAQTTFPIRVMGALGVRTLIVTNAAGSLNHSFRAGDFMLISDHIGLAAMAGMNPLVGANDDQLGPRFVDMTRAYDPGLRILARQVARELGIALHEGVYVGLFGPAFETPAEVRFLRMIGGDAVGMSTVPEIMVARHMDIRVLGISGITNVTISDPHSEATVEHDEVLAAGREMAPRLLRLLRGILKALAAAE